ncbi:MAG: hypothetical protein IJV15_07720 [Lachnospiraceae bacterium]|nr:hypothetical protein [Lachnospiraceae bacterium]
MINNLVDYFLPEQEFYLERITYNRLDKSPDIEEYLLNCTDRIKVENNNDYVRIMLERKLRFDPEEVFELSISFGAVLKFNDEKKHEHNWNEINLSEEFRENGEFVIHNLIARITLLVAEITSSYGQTPFIVPSQIVKKKNN